MKATPFIAGISIVGIAIAGIYWFTLRNQTEKNIAIRPPVEGMNVPFEQYVIYPDSSLVVERPTGTQLIFPARCFKRADGSEPQQPVTVKVREIHDPYAILMSGIPMEIAGSNGQHLESGGMIEMRAYENDQELKLKEGQSVKVELAAFSGGENFDLYYLQQDAAWMVEDTFIPRKNERKQNKINLLSEKIEQYNDSLQEQDFVFFIDADFKMNPELAPFVNQEWMLLENDKLEAAKTALRQNWSKVDIKVKNRRKMEYRITFSYEQFDSTEKGMIKPFEIIAQPIMNEKNRRQNRLAFSEKMKAYELLVKQNEEELERVKLQADLVNSFEANNMGVWNIDRILKTETIITHAIFDFESDLKGSQKDHYAYLIFEENNTVITIHRKDWEKFPFPADKKYQIVAVLNDGSVATVTHDEILRKLKSGTTDIRLNSVKKPAKDLFEMVGQLAKR
ncbi:MAG: hypothetical protein KGP35_01430 [Bacteroidetes bacterium]|nr:hypothetical protein [Bacteroidota bacterium]